MSESIAFLLMLGNTDVSGMLGLYEAYTHQPNPEVFRKGKLRADNKRIVSILPHTLGCTNSGSRPSTIRRTCKCTPPRPECQLTHIRIGSDEVSKSIKKSAHLATPSAEFLTDL